MGLLAENEFLREHRGQENPEGNQYPFAIDRPERARREIIKVVSVGGGGGNAINHVISKGIEGVGLLAVNTDARSLEMSLSGETLILGEKSTKGLGAGAIPEVGEMAARESINEIRAFLKGCDMVYFTAGMGGGTGTGALPVIAAAAKEMGILTVAVVTKPFSFEGPRKKRYAEIGIDKLRDHVDALIVVPNDRLLEVSKKDTPLTESFGLADEVLRQAVIGVTNLVTRSGLVNVDFADLRTIMSEAGPAVMGVGSASGENRIAKALEQAVESPLMECSMSGAKGVLMNISCGWDLGMYEVYEAASYAETLLSDDANFIWGCVEDPELEDRVEIVIIATGFEAGAAPSAPAYSHTQPKYSRNAPLRRRLEQFPDVQGVDGEEARLAGAPEGAVSEPEQGGLITYAPTGEKSRLISEMKKFGARGWTADVPVEVKAKPSGEKYDTPSFSRKGGTLRSQQ